MLMAPAAIKQKKKSVKRKMGIAGIAQHKNAKKRAKKISHAKQILQMQNQESAVTTYALNALSTNAKLDMFYPGVSAAPTRRTTSPLENSKNT